MIAKAEETKIAEGPPSDEAANLREWKRRYDRSTKISEALAVELAKASSQGELAWQNMRRENDWKGFLPYLKRIISLKRQEAAALSNEGEEIYDALIENFEPGENAKNIEALFDRLAGATFELARKNRSLRGKRQTARQLSWRVLRPNPCRSASSKK